MIWLLLRMILASKDSDRFPGQNVRNEKKGPLVVLRVYVRDKNLPSYVGSIIRYDKDPY